MSTCARPPLNGTVLSAFVGQRGRHTLRIGNQTGGNMIVKTRADLTGHVVASFFVAPNMEASLEGLPDGAYRIQYVLGTKLAEDCRSFIHPYAVAKLPGVQMLKTERDAGGTLRWQDPVFTLFTEPSRSGNVNPQAISMTEFNAD